MKILFDNKIIGSTITSTNENASYPAQNLCHIFDRVKYKATNINDVITVVFDENITADSFWFSYSNATAMEIKVYNNTSTLLETITADCTDSTGAEYFTSHSDVRTLVITASCAATADLQIGSFGCGVAETMPNPNALFATALESGSSASASAEGQVAYQYIEPRKSYAFIFDGVSRSEYHDIVQKFIDVDGGHIWADITESAHDVYQPLYCISSSIKSPSRDDAVSFQLSITEAR